MIKFFALLLVFGPHGELLGVQNKADPFPDLKQCTEEITGAANLMATRPLPEGVAKVKFVCLPVSDQV
jgi:hypothetical protein